MKHRLFFALDFTQDFKEQVFEIGYQALSSTGIRSIPAENLHITLKFLGDTEEKLIPELVSRASFLSELCDLPMKFTRLDLFFRNHIPSVFLLRGESNEAVEGTPLAEGNSTVGSTSSDESNTKVESTSTTGIDPAVGTALATDKESANDITTARGSKLRRIVSKLDEICSEYGFAKEKRAYLPHITFARIKRHPGAEFITKIKQHPPLDIQTEVESVVLFKSELTERGPIYTILHQFRSQK
ncbi:MAG: hypothetical protein LC102_09455 [Ignavibacteriales bacterium]|nr:MAG: hypothetical protein F9K26_03095 [Ignavibacteriaceae bacterium]MBW7872422.1 hypothetical protein [Ignavibacteria bacterium]MCZ2143640.1 hypothetical protein [Ignavibacteriales bacterium]OQY74897.1 MAG: hypothetical protein B6D45_06200 [Ignavibacteriales bacterium UTCHB3]MBV6445430.1 RNA 2',3'-cyclic phosphodiesterase [Ignavibacteriaceae bacterium]